MILSKSFETVKHGTHQVLEISCKVKHRDDIDDLSLDDFNVKLFIGGKQIAEISHLLDKAELLEPMIEKVDWHELWAEANQEQKEYRRDIFRELGDLLNPAI